MRGELRLVWENFEKPIPSPPGETFELGEWKGGTCAISWAESSANGKWEKLLMRERAGVSFSPNIKDWGLFSPLNTDLSVSVKYALLDQGAQKVLKASAKIDDALSKSSIMFQTESPVSEPYLDDALREKMREELLCQSSESMKSKGFFLDSISRLTIPRPFFQAFRISTSIDGLEPLAMWYVLILNTHK